MPMIPPDEPTTVSCPECDGDGYVTEHSDDGRMHRQHRCDLCGGEGRISHAQLLAWKEAKRRAPRGGRMT